jgi:hypothetical protein
MQDAALVVESAHLEDVAVGPAFTQTERRIVLGLLIGVHLFAATLSPSNVDSHWIHWDFIQASGWLTALFLAAAWGALSSRPIAKRLPEAIGLAAFIGIAVEWGTPANGLPWKSSPLWLVVVTALLPMLAMLFPLLLFRKFRGWRIRLASEPAAVGRGRLQFSIGQILLWTTAIGVLFGIARWIDPERMQIVESVEYEDLLMYSAMISIVMLFFLPVFVCCTGAILSERRRRRFAFWMVLIVPLSMLLLFATMLTIMYFENGRAMNDVLEEMVDGGIVCAAIVLSMAAATIGTTIVLRCCGYRLVRLPKNAAAESPFAVSTQPTATAGRSRFRRVVAAIAVIAVFLCWAAYEVRLANRQAAKDRATQDEWKELGADYAWVRYGKMNQLSFRNNQTITVAALEKLRQTGNELEIKVLSLNSASLIDDQLKYLTGLRTLRDLDLRASGISDAGLLILHELPQLENLNLCSTNITDAGLEYLTIFGHLKSLNLTGAKVTKEGVEKLQKALPNCVITFPTPTNGSTPVLREIRETDSSPASPNGAKAK